MALPRLQGWWQAGRAGRRNHPRPLEVTLFPLQHNPWWKLGVPLSHPRQERQRHSSDAMEVGAKDGFKHPQQRTLASCGPQVLRPVTSYSWLQVRFLDTEKQMLETKWNFMLQQQGAAQWLSSPFSRATSPHQERWTC